MTIHNGVSALSYSNSALQREYTDNYTSRLATDTKNAEIKTEISDAATLSISNSGYQRLINRIEATNSSATNIGTLMAEINALDAEATENAESPVAVNVLNNEIFQLKLQVSDEMFSNNVLSNPTDAFNANSNLDRDAVWALLL